MIFPLQFRGDFQVNHALIFRDVQQCGLWGWFPGSKSDAEKSDSDDPLESAFFFEGFENMLGPIA